MEHTNDPLIGRVLDGRYRIGDRIARGGMAVVYEGTDLRLDRTVAVKVMHAGLAEDDEFVSRFEREARSAARLAHHNVVAVFDQGDDNGTLFLVMEYVPGLTLRDLIRKEAPLSPAKALGLLEPVLSALGAAHAAGMIHRDVKPENVLLADSGGVKVADFGLARAINSETQHTATGGVLIGTVSYLSPELVVDGKADARADVYASGVLLYEMLTGRKPHTAESPIQVAYKHVHEDVPPPSRVVPGLPAYVDALVARATARDASLRPADARVLLHQVRRVRHALDHGVAEDPDLTEDLTPRKSSMTGTGELPRQIIDTGAPGAAALIDEVYDVDGVEVDPPGLDDDHTAPVQWVSTPPAAVQSGPMRTPPPPPRTQQSAARRPPRRSRRGPILLVALLVIALLIGLGGWYFGLARYTVTPGVLDLSQAAARAKVEKAGLSFSVSSSSFSETVARGAVMATDPQPGTRIRKNGTVHAVVSKGPERHVVPRLKGMDLDQAQATLQDHHLAFGRSILRYSEKVPQGKVMYADPKAGTPLRPDTAVDVIVSRGRQPVNVPDFTGKPADVAKRKLTKLGFKVDDSLRQYDDHIARGRVISQSPNSGRGHKGDQITLVVSRGPEMVTVPDVRRMSADDATTLLEDQGFSVNRRQSAFYIGLDRVAGTTPSPGTKVKRGSTVTLVLV